MDNSKSIDTKIITRLFFRLLPVQIMLVAIGSINSIIDGAIAGKYYRFVLGLNVLSVWV